MSDDVKIFEGSQIRSVWDNEREDWYFSVVDVIGSLTESNNPRDYWYRNVCQKKRKVNCRQFVDS